VSALVLREGAEIVLNARWRSGSSTSSQDRGSQRILGLLIGVAFVLDFVAGRGDPPGAHCIRRRNRLRRRRDGIASLCGGDIGPLFYRRRSHARGAASDRFRPLSLHPAPRLYGTAFGAARLCLGARQLGRPVGMLVLPGVAFGYRIAVEEAAMLSTLGEPYARYMRRTWRLIPYLV
jgi:hypothetical protein